MSELQLSEKGPMSCLFHNHVPQSYFNRGRDALWFFTWECACIFVSLHVCACVWLPMLLSAASRHSLRLQWKVFLCHKAVSLFPWCYDSVKIPEKTEGGAKRKINAPPPPLLPITNRSLSLAGCCHVSTHASTRVCRRCLRGTKSRKSCLAEWIFLKIFFIHWTKWMFFGGGIGPLLPSQ